MVSIFNRKQARNTGVIDVGWLIDPSWEASVIWDAPHKLSRPAAKTTHAKGVSYCPAINDHEARLTELTCPIDLHLRCGRDRKGDLAVVSFEGHMSTIRPQTLAKFFGTFPAAEWRHPERPMLQFMTPYIFIADEPVYITMCPPFYHYTGKSLPGLMLGGRFPIHIWPRGLAWAFEYYDIAKDIIINRGDPWFYVSFESEDPSRRVRLVEAEMTPELREYINAISGVTNYVNRTFSLFGTAKQRRPKRLLHAKQR